MLQLAFVFVVMVGVASGKTWMRVGLDPAARAQLLLDAMCVHSVSFEILDII